MNLQSWYPPLMSLQVRKELGIRVGDWTAILFEFKVEVVFFPICHQISLKDQNQPHYTLTSLLCLWPKPIGSCWGLTYLKTGHRYSLILKKKLFLRKTAGHCCFMEMLTKQVQKCTCWGLFIHGICWWEESQNYQQHSKVWVLKTVKLLVWLLVLRHCFTIENSVSSYMSSSYVKVSKSFYRHCTSQGCTTQRVAVPLSYTTHYFYYFSDFLD